MTLPTLYKRTSTGKIQIWTISVGTDSSGNGWIVTNYGLLDGKQQRAEEVITEGKNIGKANATTALEQAEAEAQSQWEKKVKKGYVQNLEDAEQGKIDTNMITGGIEPMLAHSYEKQGHKIVYPAYVQPKLDGHRCIAIIQNGTCTLWSRTRKRITGVPHIAQTLAGMFSNDAPVILDGELYNHDYRDNFEKLTSLIRQVVPQPGHEVIEYWVYDVVEDANPFEDRLEALNMFQNSLANETGPIRVVYTSEVQDQDEMMEIFQVYLDHGFEGLMIRNAKGIYKNKRSYDLQKVKTMQDDEFEIVDITEGRGKMAGRAMFELVTADGKPFRVKMKGTLDSLVHYYENKDQYIGRQLTVKFQNLSADGIPRFPIGERIREDV